MTVRSLSSLNQAELMSLLSGAGVDIDSRTSSLQHTGLSHSSGLSRKPLEKRESIRGLPDQASFVDTKAKVLSATNQKVDVKIEMPQISQNLDVPFASRINDFMNALAQVYNAEIFLADLEGLLLSGAGQRDYKSLASHSSVIFHELYNNPIFSLSHKVEGVVIKDDERSFIACRADLDDMSYTIILGFSSLGENQINIQTINAAAREILKAVSPRRIDA